MLHGRSGTTGAAVAVPVRDTHRMPGNHLEATSRNPALPGLIPAILSAYKSQHAPKRKRR